MILEDPPSLPPLPDLYYNPASFNLYINLFTVGLYFIIGLLFMRKNEQDSEFYAKVKRGYGLFAIFYGWCRLFFIMGMLLSGINPVFYFKCNESGYLCATLGLFFVIYVIEKYLITRTKKLFTILTIVVLVLTVLGLFNLIPHYIARAISSYSAPVLLVLVFFLHIHLAMKGTHDIRKKAVFMIVAMAFIGVGAILDNEDLNILFGQLFSTQPIVLELLFSLTAILSIIGILIFYKINRPATKSSAG